MSNQENIEDQPQLTKINVVTIPVDKDEDCPIGQIEPELSDEDLAFEN